MISLPGVNNKPERSRWGLASEWVVGLAKNLKVFFERYSGCFKTKTRDNSKFI